MQQIVNPKFLGLPWAELKKLLALKSDLAVRGVLTFYAEYLEWGECPDYDEALLRRMGPRLWRDREAFGEVMQALPEARNHVVRVPWLDVDRASIVKVRAESSERGKRGARRRWGLPPQAADDAAAHDLPKFAGMPDGVGSGPAGGIAAGHSRGPWQDCYETDEKPEVIAGGYSSTAMANCLAP